MTIYAFVGPTDTIAQRATDIDSTVQTKPGWRWIPIETTKPAYDPVTQVREGPVITVETTRVTEVWTVRAKTAGEIDADKDAVINGLDAVILNAVFRHENLIRELIRALRATSTAANNAATAAGLPTTANSADVTLAQFKAFVKSQL